MVEGFLREFVGSMSQRADIRDAFIRNYDRANRCHVTFHELAVEKQLMAPLPPVDLKDMPTVP